MTPLWCTAPWHACASPPSPALTKSGSCECLRVRPDGLARSGEPDMGAAQGDGPVAPPPATAGAAGGDHPVTGAPQGNRFDRRLDAQLRFERRLRDRMSG